MKKIIGLAIILAFAFNHQNLNAQIRAKLRDKAIEALNRKTQKEEEERQKEEQKRQEEEQAQQQEQEEQEQDYPTRQKQNEANSLMQQKMMSRMGFNSVKFETQYNFTSSMTMEIETIDSLNNKDKALYTTYFNPNDKSFAMVFDVVDRETGEKQKSTIIFDVKNWAMLILSEKNGERSGMAMKVDPDSTLSEPETTETIEQPEDFVHPFYKATGKTKTVSGYSCKEYVYTNPEGSATIWATNDQKLNFSNAYGYMNGFQALASAGWGWGMGMVMEMVFKNSNSPEQTHMIVKEIQPNSAKQLSIVGYNIVGLGGQ